MVLAVLVPTVIGAVAVGLGRLRGGRLKSEGDGGLPWWTAAAVGIAYVAGHLAVSRPALPPVDVTDRVPLVALAAAALAAAEAAWRATVTGRVLLAALVIGLVLGPVATADGLEREAVIRLAAALAVAAVAWANVEDLAARTDGADLVRALVITSVGAGLSLLLSGSAVLGQLGLALAAALAASWLAAGRPPAGAVSTTTAILTALVLIGFVYASLPATSAVLLASAPAAVWPTRLGPFRRLNPWTTAFLNTAAVMVPVAVAVGLAVAGSPPLEY
jgi:hypothetical protein